MSASNPVMTAEGADRWLVREDLHAQPGTMLGFWLYLMSDCLIFACLFAMYGVVGGNYAAGPSPKDLFELPLVAVNTAMLLFRAGGAEPKAVPLGLVARLEDLRREVLE